MANRQYIESITELLRCVVDNQRVGNDLIPIANTAIICCRSRQCIHRVPFLNPCLILILSGQKTVNNGVKSHSCKPGQLLGIPAPSSFNMINEPDLRNQQYLALCIAFDSTLVNRFLQIYPGMSVGHDNSGALHIKGGDTLLSAILHYLEIAGTPGQDEDVLGHRLMAILLCLVKYHAASHLLLSLSDQWRRRLSSLFQTDPSKSWRLEETCRLLAVSESTLRRYLRKENTSFQSILDDVRLGQALLQVQTTKLPVGHIAANCGYQSASRFSDRFKHRFRITPSQLRKTLTESE